MQGKQMVRTEICIRVLEKLLWQLLDNSIIHHIPRHALRVWEPKTMRCDDPSRKPYCIRRTHLSTSCFSI